MLICRVPMRVKWRYSSLPNVQICKSRNDTLSQLLVAHCMPYFSVLGILKYDDSLVGQLTKLLVQGDVKVRSRLAGGVYCI